MPKSCLAISVSIWVIFFFYHMELEFAKLEFHVFFFFFKSDIRFMLVGAGAGKLIFLAGTRVWQTRVPKTV